MVARVLTMSTNTHARVPLDTREQFVKRVKKANVVFLFFHVTIYTRAIVRVSILYFERVLFSVYPCVSKWLTLKVVNTNYDRMSHSEFSV